MIDSSRRQFLVGSAAAAATLALRLHTSGAEKGGTCASFLTRISESSTWTRYTGYITNRTNGYLVYDTLFSLDGNGQVKPQMVDSGRAARTAASGASRCATA